MSNISSLSLNLLLEEVYLKGKINSLTEDITKKNVSMEVNPALKQIVSELKENFNFVMTYGVGISGFVGPIKNLLTNKNIVVTDYDVSLLIITAIYILLSKPKNQIDELVEKTKDKNLNKEIPLVLNFISKSISFFKKLGNRFGYTINSLLDILSFSFLSLPVLNIIKDLVLDKGFTLNNVQELFMSLMLAITTHGFKFLINKQKIKESMESKGRFDFLYDMNLIGMQFYNPSEYREDGIVYTIWDQSSKFGTIDVKWKGLDEDDYEEGDVFFTDIYTSIDISDFIDGLESSRYVIKPPDDFPDVYDAIKSLNESKGEKEWWEYVVDDFNNMFEKPIESDEERHEIIFNTISKTKYYEGWRIYRDEMSGTVFWINSNFDIEVYATPEWEENYEIPVVIETDRGSWEEVIHTPQFTHVGEVQMWYSTKYFEKVHSIIENFIRNRGAV